jgi:hypothetical protein
MFMTTVTGVGPYSVTVRLPDRTLPAATIDMAAENRWVEVRLH